MKILIGLVKFLCFISLGGVILSAFSLLRAVFPFSLSGVINCIIWGAISYGSLSLWNWVLVARLGVPKSQGYKP